jgi:bifunctional DNase/RNase
MSSLWGSVTNWLAGKAPARPPETPTEPGRQCCGGCQRDWVAWHITELLSEGVVEEYHFCHSCSEHFFHQHPEPGFFVASGRTLARQREEATLVQPVRLVFRDGAEQHYFQLQEVGGKRNFFMICGYPEASVLYFAAKRQTFPRPLTHDAWLATIKHLGKELQDVFINDLRDEIYFAVLRLRPLDARVAEAIRPAGTSAQLEVPHAELLTIDVRPTDAIILAMKERAGIYVKDPVLAMACGEVHAPSATGFTKLKPF